MTNVVDIGVNPNRPPPASEAAEQALLAALMNRNSGIDLVADFLKAEHFYFEGHAAIYDACVKLSAQSRRFDAVTLAGVLDPDLMPNLNRYLAELQSSVVSVMNTEAYARNVHEDHIRRQLISAAQALVSGCHNPSVDRSASEDAEIFQKQVSDLLTATALPGVGPRRIGTVIEPVMDHLAKVLDAKGEIVGQSTGIEVLDHKLGGIQPPSLIIVAARPGMGKTALAINIAEHIAKAGDPVLFYSLEMNRAQITQRLMASRTGISTDRQRSGPLSRGEFLTLAECGNDIAHLPLMLDDGRERTVAAMRAHARRLQREHGLALVVVDYIQLLVGGSPRDRVAEMSILTRELKRMALDLDIPILALSQLNREVDKREDKRPQLSDLRESGSIEQDADQVVFIFREEQYMRMPKQRTNQSVDAHNTEVAIHEAKRLKVAGVAELICDKNRHGPIGTVQARWNGPRQQFSDFFADQSQEELLPDER